MKRTFDNFNDSIEFCTLLSCVKDGSMVILGALLCDPLLKQDEIVVAYIEALELGNKEATGILKKHIKHYNDETDFDFSVPETIAFYALLIGKKNAFNKLKDTELGSNFHIPGSHVVFLCALRYGYLGMMQCMMSTSKTTSSLLHGWTADNAQAKKRDSMIATTVAHSGNIEALKWIEKTQYRFPTFAPYTLREALKCGNLEFVEYLVSQGERIDNDGILNAATMAAIVKNNHFHVLKYLNSRNVTNYSELLYLQMALYSNVESMEKFEALSPTVKHGDYYRFALRAAEQDNVDALKFFYSRDPDIMLYKHHFVPHLFPVTIASHKCIRFLESANYMIKFDVLSKLKECTVLTLSALRYMRDNHFKWDAKEKISIIAAVKLGDCAMLRAVISEGADLSRVMPTLLEIAVENTDVNMVNLLVENGGNLNSMMSKLLSSAIVMGSLQMVKFLLSKSTDIQAQIDTLFSTVLGTVSRLNILEYVLSIKGVSFSSVIREKFVHTALDNRHFHLLACTRLSSLCEDQIEQSQNIFVRRLYKQYYERIQNLQSNVNPAVHSVDSDCHSLTRLSEIRTNLLQIFEMFYCAHDIPTEVLCLIATQILGIDWGEHALDKYSCLTKIVLPREIELTMINDELADLPKAAQSMYLLYQINQLPSNSRQ